MRDFAGTMRDIAIGCFGFLLGVGAVEFSERKNVEITSICCPHDGKLQCTGTGQDGLFIDKGRLGSACTVDK